MYIDQQVEQKFSEFVRAKDGAVRSSKYKAGKLSLTVKVEINRLQLEHQ